MRAAGEMQVVEELMMHRKNLCWCRMKGHRLLSDNNSAVYSFVTTLVYSFSESLNKCCFNCTLA